MAEGPAGAAPLALRVSAEPVIEAGRVLSSVLLQELSLRKIVRLAIPGGSALAAAGAARTRLGDDWNRIALTWVDERCVPHDDAESNFGAAARMGLLAAPGPRAVLPLYEDGESPAGAVERSRVGLRECFSGSLDVLLLGMGEDGHIASLFPDRPLPAVLKEAEVVHIADSPKPPADRISLTRAVLETARHAILLATGEAKRHALERLLAGDSRLPAHGLPGLVVLTDLELSVRRHDEHETAETDAIDEEGPTT